MATKIGTIHGISGVEVSRFIDTISNAMVVLLEQNPAIMEKIFLDYNKKNPDRIKTLLALSKVNDDVDLNRPELEAKVEKYVSEHKGCFIDEVIENFDGEEPILIARILEKLESAGSIDGKLAR